VIPLKSYNVFNKPINEKSAIVYYFPTKNFIETLFYNFF